MNALRDYALRGTGAALSPRATSPLPPPRPAAPPQRAGAGASSSGPGVVLQRGPDTREADARRRAEADAQARAAREQQERVEREHRAATEKQQRDEQARAREREQKEREGESRRARCRAVEADQKAAADRSRTCEASCDGARSTAQKACKAEPTIGKMAACDNRGRDEHKTLRSIVSRRPAPRDAERMQERWHRPLGSGVAPIRRRGGEDGIRPRALRDATGAVASRWARTQRMLAERRLFGAAEARMGFEPTYNGFAIRCLTTWLPRHEERTGKLAKRTLIGQRRSEAGASGLATRARARSSLQPRTRPTDNSIAPRMSVQSPHS